MSVCGPLFFPVTTAIQDHGSFQSRSLVFCPNSCCRHIWLPYVGPFPGCQCLGPTLFLLFINDLPLVLKYCKADLFADDATFHTHGKDNDTIENNIQSDFNDSKQWSKNNKMHVHDTKTSEYVPIHVQKQFYQSYILPLIDYGSITWGSTSSANLDRLSKLQKRAARVILKSDFDTPSATMFQELGWMSMESRIKYNKAVFTYKAINNMTPDYITELLTPMSQTHSLNLRSGECGALYVPFSRKALYRGSFSCSAPKLWNSLSQAVQNSESLNAFKTNVKSLC